MALPLRGMFSMALLEQRALLRLHSKNVFVAADVFEVGKEIGGRRLNAVGWNFSKHFIGTTENGVGETEIAVWTLLYAADDDFILEALDGQSNGGACSLANIHTLMTLGGYAFNRLDGQSNFAYINSPVDQSLWAAHWWLNNKNEWIIGSVQVPHPAIDWRAGSCLFTSKGHVVSHETPAQDGLNHSAPP